MDLFAGAIELTVIKDVPAQVVGTRVMSPVAADDPDLGVLRENSYVISTPGDEQA
jgi:hypothetical protein